MSHIQLTKKKLEGARKLFLSLEMVSERYLRVAMNEEPDDGADHHDDADDD